MKLESVWVPEVAAAGRAYGSPKERLLAVALLGAAILWLLAWYGDTVESMVAIWRRSDTFAHGFLIVPISAWLIWRQRDILGAIDLRPAFPALPLIALLGFAWLLGDLAGVGIVQQYGVVVMIPLMVWAILGNQLAWALLFPLFFLLFAVPFGEFLEQPLMVHTADFAVAALKLSGIPVYREGLYFTIPTGNWSVVEACSGLRYLIASLTLGVLYAYLTYRSFTRRAAFVAASIAVPIVANWLRAYMIVMIGHLSGMKYAVGVDHLIYGWLFFGLVMMLLFWIGSYWREDLDPSPAAASAMASGTGGRASLAAIVIATVAATGIVVVWPEAAEWLEARALRTPPALQAPGGVGGWQPVAERVSDWTPRYLNPSARFTETYGKGASRVGLHVSYYRNQRQDAELITSQNTLVASEDPHWARTGAAPRRLTAGDEQISAVETKLRGRPQRLLVWHWYWVDGSYTVNAYWAKLLHAKSKLLGRGDDSAVVIIYSPQDVAPETTGQTLGDFVNVMLPGITRSLEHARRGQPVS